MALFDLPHLRFVKASGCGNDFLIVNRADVPASADLGALTRKLCERTNGIGADGVEWLSLEDGCDVAARLINSDGSEAEISGNGTRCVAAWWLAQNSGTEVRVTTGAGVKRCTLSSRSDRRFAFEMEMGAALVEGRKEFRIHGDVIEGLAIDTGNPHFVVMVSSFGFDWQGMAAKIQHEAEHFPRSTNVEFVRVLDEHHLESRFYERGAGETKSSGTGSCASALAAVHLGKAASPVEVMAPGGAQFVRLEGERLFLQGPAELICEGEFFL